MTGGQGNRFVSAQAAQYPAYVEVVKLRVTPKGRQIYGSRVVSNTGAILQSDEHYRLSTATAQGARKAQIVGAPLRIADDIGAL